MGYSQLFMLMIYLGFSTVAKKFYMYNINIYLTLHCVKYTRSSLNDLKVKINRRTVQSVLYVHLHNHTSPFNKVQLSLQMCQYWLAVKPKLFIFQEAIPYSILALQ